MTAAACWRAEILDVRRSADAARVAVLRSDPSLVVLDTLPTQRAALAKVRTATGWGAPEDATRWVHYPWRRSLVHLLGPASFRALRLDRNRNKITAAEQERLGRLRVGVVGLSVGHSIAHTLAMEGICGELRLADFDDIELSNLNRIPATVLDLGVNKAVAVSRRIAELDPYLCVQALPAGLTAATVASFVAGLDIVVEECDSLDVKVLVREAARAAGVPVLMETSDRGLLDVERFDLEPDRPLFHGLLGEVCSGDLIGLSTHDKVPHVLRILEPKHLSSRMAASMAEIDETVTTWPQLGGDVTLGAATIAAAVRRLGRGPHLPSGRVRVDLDATLDLLRTPEPWADPVAAPPPGGAEIDQVPPTDPVLAVAHAANQAPSGGNGQPWTLRVDGHRLRLGLDRSRTSAMDVRFRGSLVAIGAALLNARIAAAAHNRSGPVELFPHGDASDVVADVHLRAGADLDLAGFYEAMLNRATNRHAGLASPVPLAPEVVADLHRAVAAEGGGLHLLAGRDALEEYADLLAESDRLRYLSPRLHAEMMSELRWPALDPLETGIDVRTLELDGSDLAKLAVAGRADVMAQLAAWDGGRALGQVTRERVRSSSAIAVVTCPDTRRRSYLAGGGAVQRLWLTANRAGLAVQPVSPLSVFAVDQEDFEGLVPPAYVVRLRELAGRLRGVAAMGDGEQIALVLRLSIAVPPSTRSRRIPLESVLLEGSARRLLEAG
jgi:molybdopterin/thiamine biosynthesis adenylyltransferase